MNKLKQNNAITLIALIITIIVLLILAGVVISMTLGNDGIITKAQNSAEIYNEEKLKEDASIAILEVQLEKKTSNEDFNTDLATYIMEKDSITTSTGTISYLGNDTFIFTDNDGQKLRLIKTLNGNLEIGKSIHQFQIKILKSESEQTVVKVILATEGDLIKLDENVNLTKDGYVLTGWKNANNSTETIHELEMPGHDVAIYPIWNVAEDYITLLTLAGIQNPESYTENSAYSNANIMKTVMDSEEAVNYMIKNTGNMMTKILNSTTAASAIGESTIAKQKVHDNATWVSAINNNSYSYKYLVLSLIPKMDSSCLSSNKLSVTRNGVTVTASSNQTNDCTIAQVFDKDLSTLWLTQSGVYGTHYLTVEFPSPKCITSYYYNGNGWWSNAQAYKFYLEASNDNSTWVNLEEGTIHNNSGSFDTIVTTYYVNNTNSYKYYRIHYTAGGYTWGSNGGTPAYELAFYDI